MILKMTPHFKHLQAYQPLFFPLEFSEYLNLLLSLMFPHWKNWKLWKVMLIAVEEKQLALISNWWDQSLLFVNTVAHESSKYYYHMKLTYIHFPVNCFMVPCCHCLKPMENCMWEKNLLCFVHYGVCHKRSGFSALPWPNDPPFFIFFNSRL